MIPGLPLLIVWIRFGEDWHIFNQIILFSSITNEHPNILGLLKEVLSIEFVIGDEERYISNILEFSAP